MTRAIESVEGVRYVSVSFTQETAEVQSNNCTQFVFEQINAALAREGYGGTVTHVVPIDAAASH